MALFLILLGAALSFIVISIIQWVISRHNKHQILKRYGIPGPKPDFFAGNLHHIRKEPHPNNVISSWIKKYGNVFGYYVGEAPFVVVNDLDILKQVFIKDFGLFTNRPDMYTNNGIFPETILGLRDKRWKDVRSIITPMFTSAKLKTLNDMIAKRADVTVNLIENKIKKGEMFEIYSLVQGLTLDTIASTVLAIKTNCQVNNDDELLTNVRDFFKYEHSVFVELGLIFPFLNKIFDFLSQYSAVGKNFMYIMDSIDSVIKQRTQDKNIRGSDILQAMIDKSAVNKTDENGITLSPKEVLGNAVALFGAGYETTATSLAFAFYYLVKYPEIQQRLYEEIIETKDSNYSTVMGLPYLDQVYNEVLRINPPVTGFTSRNCSQDYKAGPYTFPKGCDILAPVWDIHHDPEYWPDPWKFDPERFSAENKASIKSMSFLPFGAGPRNCVGARFAQMEAKMILFKLLQKVKLEFCEKSEDPLSLVCHTVITLPANGVWLKGSFRND